jgi:hypothetical protein
MLLSAAALKTQEEAKFIVEEQPRLGAGLWKQKPELSYCPSLLTPQSSHPQEGAVIMSIFGTNIGRDHLIVAKIRIRK